MAKPRGVDTDALQSFVPVTDFVAYPFGDAHPVHFRAGVPSTPVPVEFIKSLDKKPEPAKPAAIAADHG